MQKQAFKIMGALLVLVLAVSFSVGAVSAYEIPDNNYHDISIVTGSLVLTKNVPAWPATDIGNFVDSNTAYAALRTAYVDNVIPLYDADITFTTSSFTYVINSLNNVDATGNYVWRAYVDGTYTSNLKDVIETDSEVAFILTNAASYTNYDAIADANVAASIAFTVTFINPNSIWENNLDVTGSITGQQALVAASKIAPTFTVSISEPTPEYDYAWLNNVNGISKNWTTTGYGFAVLKNDQETDALNRFNVTANDTLKVWMAPSTYAGTYLGSATHTPTGGYYLDAATDKVTINLI